MTERPEFVDDEHLMYLDDLYKSTLPCTSGMTPYLADAFELDKEIACKIVSYWTDTFLGERGRSDDCQSQRPE